MGRLLLSRILSLSFTSVRAFSSIVVSPKLSLSSSSSSSSSLSFSRFAFSPHTHFTTYAKGSDEQTRSLPSSSNDNDDIPSDVSTEELRQRIGKYLEGDVEALPSIFEAILARKLSGKHEDSDDELMEKFRSKTQHDDQHRIIGIDGDEQIDSDEDLSDLDEDSSDLDEDLSDSNEELGD
ncbi:hypothetical protein Cgig2_021581 [Carnegiea gigantea]|uniref:Uncharacterized protein n=1 Tax=Carnegiea gigantea TaxID=171969 RepID=A0A9Q1Q6R7_9CARY|nr:hypothetical protein Cgig2_021581 [Carnegiea gigantea]